MRHHPILASMLSMLVPGLGQMYAMQTDRGLMIFIAFLIVGNLNVIWLSLFAATRTTFAPDDFGQFYCLAGYMICSPFMVWFFLPGRSSMLFV